MDALIEVRQVVLTRPAFDFASVPIRSSVAVGTSAIVLLQPLLILALELMVEDDAPNLRAPSNPLTFVLLPSMDFEACVSEIVRRQLARVFARSPEREEEVIRERFFTYLALPARKVETSRATEAVVAELVAALAARQAAAPDGTGARSRAPSRSVHRDSRVPQVSGRR